MTPLRKVFLVLICVSTTGVAAPVPKNPSEPFADPIAAVRTFLRAVEDGDADLAKECWVGGDAVWNNRIDHWVANRRLLVQTDRRFPEAGRAAVSQFNRTDLSDGVFAPRLKVWAMSDKLVDVGLEGGEGKPLPFVNDNATVCVRRVAGLWKLDARALTNEPGADPRGRLRIARLGGVPELNKKWLLRDQAAIMADLADRLEAGEFRSVTELSSALDKHLSWQEVLHHVDQGGVSDMTRP